ncbi:MAG: NUDIX hydrolase [Myxococcota bacterium]
MLRLAGALGAAAWSWAKLGFWGLAVGESRPLVVAQAVVLDPARGVLLALRRDLQGWELPGGTVEPGESPERALARELREELGIDAAVGRRVGTWVRTGYRPHTAHVFVCATADEPCARGPLGDETLDAAWFPADAPPATLFPWYAEAFLLATSGELPPVERRERNGWREIAAGARIDLATRAERLRSR